MNQEDKKEDQGTRCTVLPYRIPSVKSLDVSLEIYIYIVITEPILGLDLLKTPSTFKEGPEDPVAICLVRLEL